MTPEIKFEQLNLETIEKNLDSSVSEVMRENINNADVDADEMMTMACFWIRALAEHRSYRRLRLVIEFATAEQNTAVDAVIFGSNKWQ